MGGSHQGTLLSSTSTLKEPNNNSVGTNTEYSNKTGVRTHTKVVLYVVVATNSTHTKVVHTNSRHGSHKHVEI